MGIAFQLQDDYLDAFGNPKNFGKQLGGDIISNKKTFLYLTAVHQGNADQADELVNLFSISPKDPTDKIKTVISIFESTGAAEATKKEIEKYTEMANQVLDQMKISPEHKKALYDFGNSLMSRSV